MILPVIAKRRSEREARIEFARRYAIALSTRVDLVSATVFGSVARGDWNKWSDIDVLVVAEGLPESAPERIGLLLDPAFAGVQPLGWTPAELASHADRADPLLQEVSEHGIDVYGRLGPGPTEDVGLRRPSPLRRGSS